MNYFNPYYMINPMMQTSRPGLFGALRSVGRGFNLSSIMDGTQRTLGLINQAIPIVKQMSPVMKNARTMFKVMNEFKKVETPMRTGVTNNNGNTSNNMGNLADVESKTRTVSESGPTFFA